MSPPLEFPPLLTLPLDEAWEWPRPPFAWRHSTGVEDGTPGPCRIEMRDGSVVEGRLLTIEPAHARARLQPPGEGEPIEMPLAAMLRLTLTAPLEPASRMADAPLERVPAAAQEREYRLHASEATPPSIGRTCGYIEAAEGLYLFTPLDEERSLLRVFIPRSAYVRCTFGASAQEIAAARWIADPQAQLQAIERQQRMPVLPIGRSLLELGMLTPAQLERALAEQQPDTPLGEMLVARGMLSRSDLRTALAHKMGFPLVDLARFPIQPEAAKRLPLRVALESSSLPIMVDGQRLIVVMDRPSRAAKLRHVRAFAQLSIVPVLASKSRILDALTRLSQQDVWSENVALVMHFFETTT